MEKKVEHELTPKEKLMFGKVGLKVWVRNNFMHWYWAQCWLLGHGRPYMLYDDCHPEQMRCPNCGKHQL